MRLSGPVRPHHVILDRDGVLNREPPHGWISSVEEWRWETGATAALETLAAEGVKVSVATNQSGIGRGIVDARSVARLHEWLGGVFEEMGVDLVGIFVCPHAPADGCSCRKPQPGLILEAVSASGVPASETVVIGDALRDLEAGAAAGVVGILVRSGKGGKGGKAAVGGTRTHDDVAGAVRALFE